MEPNKQQGFLSEHRLSHSGVSHIRRWRSTSARADWKTGAFFMLVSFWLPINFSDSWRPQLPLKANQSLEAFAPPEALIDGESAKALHDLLDCLWWKLPKKQKHLALPKKPLFKWNRKNTRLLPLQWEKHKVITQSDYLQTIRVVGAWRDAPIMPSSKCTSLWGQCHHLASSSWSALGSATACSQRMRSAVYLNTLNGQVIDSMDFYSLDGMGIFQDDNARICWAQVVKEWFRENEMPLSLMDWPPYSPDLNPVENLWNVLKKTFHSGQASIVNATSSQINTALDGNKSCYIAEAHQNSATASSKLKVVQWNMQMCKLFFGGDFLMCRQCRQSRIIFNLLLHFQCRRTNQK